MTNKNICLQEHPVAVSHHLSFFWQKIYTLAAMLCLFSMSLSGFAAQLQSHESLYRFAKQFVKSELDGPYKLTVKTGYLDKRLRLPACKGPLTGFFPSERRVGNTTIVIRCESEDWKVHLSVKVKAIQPVVVASQAIPKGTVITEKDIRFREVDIGRHYAGVFTAPEQIIGMVTRRNIRQDSVLTPKLVNPKRLISRGEPITIHAKAGNLWIRVEGTALMDGHRGQLIEVENRRSGRKIMAEVIAPAAVKVKM